MSKDYKIEDTISVFLDLLDREITSKALVRSLLNGGVEVDPGFKKIKLGLLSLYLTSHIHTFFLPDTLIKISESIHSNPDIRDFISEIVNKLYILLGKEHVEIFCKEVCSNIESLHNREDSTYIGPQQYVLSLYFEPGTANSNTLVKNPWMMFMILLLLCFDKSKFFNISENS